MISKNSTFKMLLIKSSTGIFGKVKSLILKFIWNSKGPRIEETIFEVKQEGEFSLILRPIVKVTVIKTAWY